MADRLDGYYMVWGVDQSAYGPADLATLATWAEDGRVTPESWVFSAQSGAWQKARKVPGLKRVFSGSGDTTRLAAPPRIDPRLLREVKVLRGLTEEQLSLFARVVELEETPEGARVVTSGEMDDTLYFILSGTLKVRLQVMDKQVVLTGLGAGDFFGDVALLNRSGRSADVVADSRCLLARLSSSALDELTRRDVAGCTQFLRAIDEELSERIRADNQRLASVLNAAQAKP